MIDGTDEGGNDGFTDGLEEGPQDGAGVGDSAVGCTEVKEGNEVGPTDKGRKEGNIEGKDVGSTEG